MFYKTLSLNELKREFIAYDRDYFTEEGLEYIEEVMTMGNLDEPVELDVIAICGEFTECSMPNFVSDKNIGFSDFDDDTLIEQFADYIEDNFIISDLQNIPDIDDMIEELVDAEYFDSINEARNSSIELRYILSYIDAYSSLVEVLDYLLDGFQKAFEIADDPKSLLEQYLDNEGINYRFLSNGSIIYCNY